MTWKVKTGMGGRAVTATKPSLMQFWEVSLFQPCVLLYSLSSAHDLVPRELNYGLIPGLFCKGVVSTALDPDPGPAP